MSHGRIPGGRRAGVLALLALFPQAAPAPDNARAVRDAIDATAAAGYSYEVRGKYERAGEFTSRGLLTSRVRQYQSARLGEAILVKGPEGLWKTPGERLGEKVEKPDPEASAIVSLLQDAAAPHAMVRDLLDLSEKALGPEDREVDGVMCRRYQLVFSAATLKDSVSRQMDKETRAGIRPPPDEIRWSTLKGSARVYADKRTGLLVKVVDERSVKIATRVPDQPPDVKTYKVQIEFVFSRPDPDKFPVPREVRERLGLREE